MKKIIILGNDENGKIISHVYRDKKPKEPMKPLIPPQEVEKAARENPIVKSWVDCAESNDMIKVYQQATEACNKKFDEDVKPVLEEAKKAIEQALNLKNLWYYAEGEKIPEEHIGEAVALVVMKNKLESALTNLNNLIK